MTPILYGIPNCDTVKKAKAWLDRHGIAYTFHDFKKSGVSRDLLDAWLKEVEWEVLLNRKGTTWRGLSEERKGSVNDAAGAAGLMQETPSIIKRPVLAYADRTHVGFSEAGYQQIFNK